MKYLLNGVAIAAALALASPVWAQTSAAPMHNAAKPMHKAAKQMHHRRARHMAKHGGMHKMTAGNRMTEELNREELARIQSGNMTPPMPAPPKSAATPFKKGM